MDLMILVTNVQFPIYAILRELTGICSQPFPITDLLRMLPV